MKSRQEIERLSRQKLKNRFLFILLCLLIAFVAAAIILVNLIPDSNSTTSNTPTELPEILENEGEALYGNYPIAYPTIQESQIQTIIITNKASYADDYNEGDENIPKTSYMLTRDDLTNGKFVLSFEDENGKLHAYYPDIIELDSSFDYESLYSKELNDGYQRIYKLTYLCAAIELPYFTDRIALQPKGEEREAQLKRFGLGKEDSTEMIFTYTYTEKDANGNKVEKEATKVVLIGKKNVTGVGYYFMVGNFVDGEIVYREYIYNSMANYYDYAMLGFYSYVNSILVSAGLPEDQAFEPYLTTDYKQWINKLVGIPEEDGAEIPQIPEKSKVVITTDVFSPLESRLDSLDAEKKDDVLYDSEVADENKDGYIKDLASELEIDLSNKEKYSKFIKALVGRKLGKFEKDIFVTLTSDSKTIELGELESLEYTYEIINIEAIVTDGADITEAGTLVGDNNLIRASYILHVEGEKISNIPYHGVFDLSNADWDEAAVSAIRASAIGELTSSISLGVEYSAENAKPMTIKYVVEEIVAIYNKEGKEISKVTEDSIVCYRWSVIINGERQSYENGYVDFNAEENALTAGLKNQLVGLKKEKNLYKVFFNTTVYCEFVLDFMTYGVKSAEYFITSELVSAFRFQNSSERDPFYGESIYENTMDSEYALYAINSSACEAVAKKLGGIGETTGTSDGLVGLETVAVGLTPDVKKKYGLYDYTIYFELPRGIIVRDSGDDETLDDYSHYSTLGFTLHISEKRYDAELGEYIRYVGSDLYDIVSKVYASDLEFLEYRFVDFWARRSLMMFDVRDLAEMKVEFMMEDVKGSYIFNVPTASKNGNKFAVNVLGGCDHEDDCGCTETKISELISASKTHATSITTLYNTTLGNQPGVYKDSNGNVLYGVGSTDTAGVAYFKEIMAILFATAYDGAIGAEEDSDALVADSSLLMRISIKLDLNTAENTSKNTHVYEFYRCDDRRVIVRLYELDPDVDPSEQRIVDVTDFYVSTFAFKKIVGSYFALLNGEKFTSESAYPEVTK